MNTPNTTAGNMVEEIELLIKNTIRKKLEALPVEDKQALKLVPYESDIPDNEEHIDIYIRSFAGRLATELKWWPVGTAWALNKLDAQGISLKNTTADHYGAVIEEAIRKLSLEQMRVAGVFGEPHTQQDVDEMMSRLVQRKYGVIVQYLAKDHDQKSEL